MRSDVINFIAPTCTDAVTNADETDVDCGGGACPKCGWKKACLINSDCLGGSCVSMICTATCSDGSKNQDETDVDCGGSFCGGCALNRTCSINEDCLSNLCENSKCVPASGPVSAPQSVPVSTPQASNEPIAEPVTEPVADEPIADDGNTPAKDQVASAVTAAFNAVLAVILSLFAM